MKISPIQLLDSTLLKVAIDLSKDDRFLPDQYSPAIWDKVAFKTFRQFTKAPSFWSERKLPVDGIDSRTYAIQLGVKADPIEDEDWSPYTFEIVFGVLVAVVKEGEEESVEKMAFQYGLQFAFGSVRELLLSMTSRMQYGPMLLPTMSFMDEVPIKPQEEVGEIGE